MTPDYRLEIINNQSKLENLVNQISSIAVVALDIETIEWWNRQREQIALLQFAFRRENEVKVAVVDALAELSLEPLFSVLTSQAILKVIHNAVFDAGKIAKFYQIKITPVFDTMLAARRSGEKKYSLQAQSAIHLKLFLDKASQRSDWSRRPLDFKQLNYAALDAAACLLLYENQKLRNLPGSYGLKPNASANQLAFGFEESNDQTNVSGNQDTVQGSQISDPLKVSDPEISSSMLALLGIISRLPARYGPEQLAVSVGIDRVGLTGWIIDRQIGRETDFDEESARMMIAELIERKLIRFTETRRLEATDKGVRIWKQLDNK